MRAQANTCQVGAVVGDVQGAARCKRAGTSGAGAARCKHAGTSGAGAARCKHAGTSGAGAARCKRAGTVTRTPVRVVCLQA